MLKVNISQLLLMFQNRNFKDIISCEVFIKDPVPQAKFLVVSGIEDIKKELMEFRFSKNDIKYLKSLPQLSYLFNSGFEKFLETFKFRGDMWAMTDGEIAFTGEPVLRITGSLPEICIAESIIIPILNYNSNISSKSARLILASGSKKLYECFDNIYNKPLLDAIKSSYLVGFSGTSNIFASIKYNIPLYSGIKDNSCKNRIDFNILEKDLYYNILKTKEELRRDKFYSTQIAVYGNIDEDFIELTKHLPIDIYIINSNLSANLNYIFRPVYNETTNSFIKLNDGTIPGKKQVYLKDKGHIIALDEEVINEFPLLEKHIEEGEIIEDLVSLDISRRYCNAALVNLEPPISTLDKEIIQVPVIAHESIRKGFQ